jgi:hypothetical protein
MFGKKPLITWKFTFTALVALLFAWFNTALNMGGISYLQNVVINPYYSGAMIGTSVKWLAYAFVAATAVNFIANRFRKEKKHFSYLVVWLFLAISIAATMSKILQQLGIEEPAARYNFIQGCIADGKANKDYRALKEDVQQQALYNISKYCDDVATGYFNLYDSCMRTTQDKLACNKQALFKQCMAMKKDQEFCQKFTASLSIK